ncbi:biotin--[acetyl-CoA-carboxylase] ligase [Phaeacidiphilus oryzae]|uniref:biotin--[acetyl-CoA-carboxylase] ligase n=1 Tax=Phaeacidiphilus oryzae TaxID=348818 RepID=UPI00056650B7|nr:biotin--[acetyl-CoA-carboxylase] ligase [Phaeacidiphilus oryzae]
MSSSWTDLERPPLREAALRRALVREGGLWSALTVLPRTGSTNTDLAAQARSGAPAGAVLLADEQTAGRGRLDRAWAAPPRSGIHCSFLLRPTAPLTRWGWLPLLTGVAAAGALSRAAELDVRLKWPNDLLVPVGGEERKLGGILAEAVSGGPASEEGDGVVIGVGVNVSLTAEELPVPTAGSLKLAGSAHLDRDTLVRMVLREFADRYRAWEEAGGDPDGSGLREAYLERCATIGRTVRVELPGDRELRGEAVSVDDDGRLVVRAGDGAEEAVGAGDVVHVRPV